MLFVCTNLNEVKSKFSYPANNNKKSCNCRRRGSQALRLAN